MEWAQVKAMAADGVSQREIARRLGINRRTVRRLFGSPEPPHYRRTPQGSSCRPGPGSPGGERRTYALVGSLPYSGAQSAHFSFDMTLESFLEGHVRLFDRPIPASTFGAFVNWMSAYSTTWT